MQVSAGMVVDEYTLTDGVLRKPSVRIFIYLPKAALNMIAITRV